MAPLSISLGNFIGSSTLYGGGGVDERFIITVKTDNAGTSADTQFTIPTSTTGITQAFNYDIVTSDGQTITGVTGDQTITFPTAGEYEVKISGSFPYMFFNQSGDKDKLLDIKNFGIYALGSTNQTGAFRGCSNMIINATDIGHFENVTDFTNAWRGCASLISFPLLDTSSGTNFTFTWRDCSSLTSFPLLDTSSVTNFNQAWFNCSSLTSFPLLDTSSGTNFFRTWRDCTGLTSFPLLDTSSGTNFSGNWLGCTGLTSFPLLDTSSGTNFSDTWFNCSSLTSFPLLDTSSGTNFSGTWRFCSSLTSFPSNAFDTNIATDYTLAFQSTNLTTQSIDDILVSLDTSGISNGTFTQSGGQGPSYVGSIAVNNLTAKGWTITTSTPVTDNRFIFSVKTDNAGTSGTNQFTLPTTGTGYNYDVEYDGQTLTGQTGSVTLTFPSGAGTYDVKISGSFPQCYFNNGGDKAKLLDIKNFGIYAQGSISQSGAFYGCSNLIINATDIGHFENVTNFQNAWRFCSSLTSFPLIDTSSGTNFNFTWTNCSSLTSFPLLDTNSGTNFGASWRNCSSLTSFPANAFDTNIASNYVLAFVNTNLTTQSIDDILVSLDTSGVSNGTFAQSGGQGRSYNSNAAVSNLIAKGWTLTLTTPVASPEFAFTVKTDNAGTSTDTQFTIPTSVVGITQALLYDIETSDGQTITGVTGDTTITFPSAGTYDVRISGSFPYMYFANGGDGLKMLDIKNFGIYALGSTSQFAAFQGCSNMTITATDTGNFGSVTDFYATWIGCSSLTSFPLIDTSNGTSFSQTWRGCSSLTSFPLLDTSSGTDFSNAWRSCSSLTSFPLLDTSSVTNFSNAWRLCSSLANFPANSFNTNIAINYTDAFVSTNLTTQSIDDILVSLDTSGVTNGTFTQSGGQGRSYNSNEAVSNLIAKGWTLTLTTPVASDEFVFTVKTDNTGTSTDTQFTIPTSTTGITQAFNYDIETSDGQTITGNTGNTTITFPSAGTYDIFISGSFPYMYFINGGDKLKLLDIKNFGIYALGSTSQFAAFFGCSNMVISASDVGNFASGTIFDRTWQFCSSLTSFPLIDTSSGINFIRAWNGCSSLTSFPLLDTSSGTNFGKTWNNCSSLTSFPANAFDTNTGSDYTDAFGNTNLTIQSIDDILVSLDTSGVSNGTFTQSGGQAPSATGQTAIDSLVGKGWTITVTSLTIVQNFKTRVIADGGTFEAESCLNAALTNLNDI